MTREQRRLAAIVSADVVGYSLLMGRDESGTLAGLKATRRELIDPKIAEYGGRIVKTTGDGLLVEFPSVVDAVRCAVDVQRAIAERNAGIPVDKRIDFRIGINVGDIIIDDDDIFGDGVNVAARLQTLAERGGICVSRVVRDQVRDKLSFAFEDLGAQEVKNIARPVEAYRVALGGEIPTAQSGRKRLTVLPRGNRWKWLAGGVLALGLAGIGAWTLSQIIGPAPAPAPPMGSFAVLPFTATNPADAPMAQTLTANLTSALQRGLPSMPVVSHGVAATYSGKSIDARTVGRELNVGYLVEGELRTAAEKVVVKARLIETTKGMETWSDDVEVGASKGMQPESALLTRLTIQLRSALVDAEERRVLAQPIARLSAADLAVRADAVRRKDPMSVSALDEARKLYDQALRLDPTLTSAMMGRALTVANKLLLDPHADRDSLVREYETMSMRIVAVAGREARAWNIRADALQWQWRWEAALEANAKAASIDPTRVGGIGQRADLMVATGKPEEALAIVDAALSLQPPDAPIAAYLSISRCRAFMALGRYADAVAACEKAASFDDWWFPHVYLVAAYALQDIAAKASAERAKLFTLRPTFSIADFKALGLSNVPAYLEQTEAHLLPGLRKAAIPEK